MVQIQGMTGMRPTEVCIMRVGDIDRSGDVWKYRPKDHKTEEYIGKKVVHLGKDEQVLIAPYLIGKTAGQAVFSPRTAMAERNAERRANRKSKITPSQAERNRQRAEKPVRYEEFYDASSYRKAIGHAIAKAKREGVVIPHWTPYQLRHGAGTRAEKEHGLDAAQALLAHTSAQMTKRYAHGRQSITENMARNRRNPFLTKESAASE
jgi:integrase